MNQAGPNFLIVGAARAGTTGLAAGLRRHSEVFVTDPKEPHYFAYHGQDLAFRGPGDEAFVNQASTTEEDAYRRLYPTSAGPLARGDGSVSSLYFHQRAIPEILRIEPQMRIVILLREPVARAYSSWLYLRGLGFEETEDFLAAVAEEPERIADNWHHLWHYTGMSMYAEAVAAFQAAFPPGNVGVFFFDDLQTDYEGTLLRVLTFLGVPPDPSPTTEVPRINASGMVKFAGAQKVLWWATRHPALKTVVRSLSTYRFREAVRARMITRGDVPLAVTEALAPRFTQDLAALRPLLDERVPLWLKGDPR